MSSIIILLFVAAWAAVLLPLARSSVTGVRAESRGIKSFSRQLDRLERPTSAMARHVPGQPVADLVGIPSSAQAARERRIVVFAVLGFAAVVSLLASVTLSANLFLVHLFCDVLLAGFAWLNLQRNTMARERAEKVRPLPIRPPIGAPMPQPLRRRA